MISLVTGRQGSGKTLLLVLQALRARAEGRVVYSNVHLVGIPYKKIMIDDVVHSRLENGVCLIDEIHQFLPSRRSLSARSVSIVDGFLSMVRKKRLELWGSTQLERKVDVRLREEKDFFFVCSKQIHDGSGFKDIVGFDWPKGDVFVRVDGLDVFSNHSRTFRFYANALYSKYDTSQVIRIE